MTQQALSGSGLKAIVFDLDGTLYQNDRIGEEVATSALRYVAGLKGISEEEAGELLKRVREEQRHLGGTLSHSVLAMGGDLRSLHAALAAGVHPEGVLRVDPRVPQLLKRLSASFDLYLYTNNNRKLSGRIMQEIGVTGFFKRVFTVEDFWRPKPEADIVRAILSEIGARPQETLFVGDRFEVDLQIPASLGCPVWETPTVEELLQLQQLLPATVQEG